MQSALHIYAPCSPNYLNECVSKKNYDGGKVGLGTQ